MTAATTSTARRLRTDGHGDTTPRAPREKPYRTRGSSTLGKPTLAGLIVRYGILIVVFVIMVFPFVWQLSTSLKGVDESIFSFPPHLIPDELTLSNYAQVFHIIPVLDYMWHSLLVGVGTVLTNIVFATIGGYALGCLRFRFKGLVIGIIFSTLLLPAEVTFTSQYLTIKSLGMANTLWGVFMPTAIGAINVLLMMAACHMIPKETLEAATIDGANTLQRLWHIVWPNVRGMASVVALFSFIGAWDDFLWPLVVLSDPSKYTLTVGMEYLNSNFSANPRIIAAGTMIALIPIIILFAVLQKHFFKGVEDGAVKG